MMKIKRIDHYDEDKINRVKDSFKDMFSKEL